MEALNYCRQISTQFRDQIALAGGRESPVGKAAWERIIALCAQAQKFQLPAGGELFDDPEMRGLDESDPLRLPFPVVALEFELENDATEEHDDERNSKVCLFASERTEDEVIVINTVLYLAKQRRWGVAQAAGLARTGGITRLANGELDLRAVFPPRPPTGPDEHRDSIVTLLGFLNALQCVNVSTQRVAQRRDQKLKKGALPFDDYHVLMLKSREDSQHSTPLASTGGGGRQLREHVRRGHIRRLEDGRRLWINSTVVNPGVRGRVSKRYWLKL